MLRMITRGQEDGDVRTETRTERGLILKKNQELTVQGGENFFAPLHD